MVDVLDFGDDALDARIAGADTRRQAALEGETEVEMLRREVAELRRKLAEKG